MKRLALGCACLLLAACERGMHDMYAQPYDRALAPDARFADGRSARPPPAGSVPRAAGVRAGSSSGRRGAVPAEPPRPPMSMALLERGRERYDIFCAPCHGLAGDGDGMIARRGFPAPPSYHQPRLREADDADLEATIRDGRGQMPGYGDRLAPADRWAVIAYLRALQLSRHAPLSQLPARDRAVLEGRR